MGRRRPSGKIMVVSGERGVHFKSSPSDQRSPTCSSLTLPSFLLRSFGTPGGMGSSKTQAARQLGSNINILTVPATS